MLELRNLSFGVDAGPGKKEILKELNKINYRAIKTCIPENYNYLTYDDELESVFEKSYESIVPFSTPSTITLSENSKFLILNSYTTGLSPSVMEYMIREMDGMRENIIKGDRLDTIIKMEPQDFLITKGMQQTMTSTELDEYIAKQKRRGFANIKEFQIEYHQRIAMSFAAFILTIIGVSLSSRKVKGGMGLYLGIGLALSFSYILFQTISATFAVNGNTPPVLAVWIPNILYTFIAIYLYRKAPR